MKERMKRDQVPVEMTWDLGALYSDDTAWTDHLAQMMSEVTVLEGYKGRLNEGGKVLFEAVTAFEAYTIELYRLGTYANLKQSVDGTNTACQEMSMKFQAMATQVQTRLTFFENEIMNFTEAAFNQCFIDAPELEVYRSYLETIYEEKLHKLQPETEEVLAALGELTSAPYRTYSISKAADMQFESFTDSEGNELPNSFALFEGKYEFSKDANVRARGYRSFVKTLERYKNTYAAVYATEVKKQVAMSRIRGYQSVTEMLLKPQKVTLEMYHRQIDVIYNQLAPHMRKYAALLKRELGLDKVNFWDLKAPIDTSFDPPATLDEAKATILEALAVLGDEYSAIMEKAFNERWIDFSDNVGKSTGAFCASPYAAHPYILVTFNDNMRCAFTLAHELGHAGHFYLANRAQKLFNTRPSTYMVEAPSTMNEMLLGRHLMAKTDDPKMKKWVILQFMGTYYHNFVTHLLEAAFQRKVYDFAEAGMPLTAKLLCDTKLEVIRNFWGDSVDVEESAGMTWMRQPHYYMGLYPYTYSAGLTASTAVSEQIAIEGGPAVARWLEMLRLGGTLKPLELLKVAGMDLNSDAPVEQAVRYVGSLIDDLVKLCEC